MKERIKATISDNIINGLSDENDVDYSQRILALEEASENLQQLINGVNDLIDDFVVKRDAVNIQKELSMFNIPLLDLTDYGYDEKNFGVKIAINGKCGYIVYGYGDKEYIGFAFDTYSLTRTEVCILNRLFRKFGKNNSGEESLWPCWEHIGETTLLNEFSNFVQFVKFQADNDKKYPIEFKYSQNTEIAKAD